MLSEKAKEVLNEVEVAENWKFDLEAGSFTDTKLFEILKDAYEDLELLDDKEFRTRLSEIITDKLKNMDMEYRNNPDFMESIMIFYPAAVEYASEELKDNYGFMLSSIDYSLDGINFASERLLNSPEFALDSVWENGDTILSFENGDLLSKNREILMVAGLRLHMMYGGMTPSFAENHSQYSGTLRDYREGNDGFEQLISYLGGKEELSYTEKEILDAACEEEYDMDYETFKEYREEQDSYEHWLESEELDLIMDFHEKQREKGGDYDFEAYLQYALEEARESHNTAKQEFIRLRREELVEKYGTKEEDLEENTVGSLRDIVEDKEEELAELIEVIDSRQEILFEIEEKYQALQDEMDKKDGKRGVNR